MTPLLPDTLTELTRFARVIRTTRDLIPLLQELVDTAARLLGADRVSSRLFAADRSRLLLTCRAGAPLHAGHAVEFKPGEGLVGWVATARMPLRAFDGELDPRFSKRQGLHSPMGAFLGVPLIAGEACMGVLSAVHPTPGHFTKEHEQLLVLLATMAAPSIELERLSRLSRLDPLTGVLNRRGLNQTIDSVGTDETALSAIMVDADHFKAVNDNYGHAVGDAVLKRLANLIGQAVRRNDRVARIGGEEFVVLLPGVGLEAAHIIAERARVSIEEAEWHVGNVPFRVTVSMGVAERLPGEGHEALMARADTALYAAKAAGRNRVLAA